jgi:hypothetical protein
VAISIVASDRSDKTDVRRPLSVRRLREHTHDSTGPSCSSSLPQPTRSPTTRVSWPLLSRRTILQGHVRYETSSHDLLPSIRSERASVRASGEGSTASRTSSPESVLSRRRIARPALSTPIATQVSPTIAAVATES